MSDLKLPETNSIQELAEFWDTHDLTDFEDELEEVESLFVKESEVVLVRFDREELERIKAIAKQENTSQAALIRRWVTARLQT